MDGVTAPSRTRRRAFALLAVSIPALTFGALEGALRALHYQGDLSLFVRLPYAAGQYMGVNDRVAARYFLNVRMLPTPPTDIFLAAKPTHGFRVFVLGESSAAGFPYLHNGTFARVLQDALQDVMPGDTVEVVNLGVAAITSYALYDEIDEILAQHPDAVVLYAGHNEFYGALGVGSTETLGAVPALVRTYLRLERRLKTVLLARGLVGGLGRWRPRPCPRLSACSAPPARRWRGGIAPPPASCLRRRGTSMPCGSGRRASSTRSSARSRARRARTTCRWTRRSRQPPRTGFPAQSYSGSTCTPTRLAIT